MSDERYRSVCGGHTGSPGKLGHPGPNPPTPEELKELERRQAEIDKREQASALRLVPQEVLRQACVEGKKEELHKLVAPCTLPEPPLHFNRTNCGNFKCNDEDEK